MATEHGKVQNASEMGCFLAFFLGGIPAILAGIITQSLLVALGVVLGVFVVVSLLALFTISEYGRKVVLPFLVLWLAPGIYMPLLLGIPVWWGLACAVAVSLGVAASFYLGNFEEGHWEHHGFVHDWQHNFGKCWPVGCILLVNGAVVGAVVGISVVPAFFLCVFGVSIKGAFVVVACLSGALGAFSGIWLTPVVTHHLYSRD